MVSCSIRTPRFGHLAQLLYFCGLLFSHHLNELRPSTPPFSPAGLKKFKHLVGNYGGAWYKQKKEFAEFPGAILMTTK